MSGSTYRYVGVSTDAGGITAVRYCSDSRARTRVLEKHGHTNIFFIDMGQDETPEECVDALMTRVETDELWHLLDPVREEALRVGFVV